MRPARSTLALAPLLLLTGCGALLTGCGEGGPGGEPLGTSEQAMQVCPGPTVLEGIDVSGYQPNTDWAQVAASGRSFAIVKATEGTGYVNPFFAQDWKGLKDNGMARGAYHFFHSTDDPIASADHFLATMPALQPGDLPPTLDLEVTDGQSADTINTTAAAWLKHVADATKTRPILYTSPSFFRDTLGSPSALSDLSQLWIANWGVSCPEVPAPFQTWPFWQYDDMGSVPGVQGGAVDLDRFNGTLADLAALGGGAPATTPSVDQVTGNDAMALVNWPDEHAEVFVKSKGSAMHHIYTMGKTDVWSPLDPLDQGGECGFGAVFWPAPSNHAELFSPTASGGTQHLYWDKKAGWSKFTDFGGKALSHLSTLAWPDGHVEAFALGGDGAIWHDFFDLPSGAWSGWTSLKGVNFVTGVAPILGADGHAELFATDASGVAWHDWSGAFPGGWHGWAKLGGDLSSRPIPVRWATGELEAFARGNDGLAYHAWTDAGGAWQPFVTVGKTPIAGEPTVLVNPAGNGAVPGPEVFARDPAGKVVHLWWTKAMTWTDFAPLGDQTAASDPLAWIRSDGRAEVFAIDDAGALVKSYHDPAAGWGPWAAIGGTDLDPCLPVPADMDGGPGATTGSGAGGAGTTAGSGGRGHGSAGSSGGAGGSGAAPGSKSGCACRNAGTSPPANGWLLGALGALPLLAWSRARGSRRRPGRIEK